MSSSEYVWNSKEISSEGEITEMTSPTKAQNTIWELYPAFGGILVYQWKDKGTSVNRS